MFSKLAYDRRVVWWHEIELAKAFSPTKNSSPSRALLGNSAWNQRIYTTGIPPSVDVLGNQRRIYLIPCLCGVGCRRTILLKMEGGW